MGGPDCLGKPVTAMRLAAAFLVFLSGAGLLVGLKSVGDATRDPAESGRPEQKAIAAPVGGEPALPVRANAVAAPPKLARIVASGVIAAPQIAGDIERIPARPSLSPAPQKPQQVAATDPSRWRIRLLHQPVATSAGEIEAGGYRLVLEGIVPTDPAMSCKTAEGASWPCGLQARTAFRAFLRARSIRCKVPAQPTDQVVETTCSLGGEDVAAWLMAHGWARPANSGAVAQGVGLSGPPPR